MKSMFKWKLDNFDTEVFGFRVAKIEILQKGSEEDLIKNLAKNKIAYATYRVPSSDFSRIHALEKSNFILTDGLITLSIDLSEIEIGETVKEIREANRNDIDKLRDLTSGLYSGTRVFNDPFISEDKANEFYMRWVENSVMGKAADSVLVWEEEGEILGYITLKRNGSIPLIGVSKKAQGKGIGKSLIKASFNKFRQWGLKKVIIETQINNIPALRTYQACGFKITDSHLTFRWSKK